MRTQLVEVALRMAFFIRPLRGFVDPAREQWVGGAGKNSSAAHRRHRSEQLVGEQFLVDDAAVGSEGAS